MPKKTMTRKQAAAKRRQDQEEQAARNRLLKQLAPRESKPRKSVAQIPRLDYEAAGHSNSAKSVPSAIEVFGVTPFIPQEKPVTMLPEDQRDDADINAREAAAQDEIAVKKTRVAPAYNKGPYIFVTDDMDPTQIGSRKI